MHKSLGNGIEPSEITEKYGADILRLWVASSDYHSDIRISKDILSQLSDAYKKIRNTARFILGNIGDFDIDKDAVSLDALCDIDKWALVKLDELIDKVNSAYSAFDYHIVFHAIHNFCVTDMSNFYLDILKDRLYCEKSDSTLRRAAQTVMYKVLSAISRLVAPILSFTADEIWGYIPHSVKDNTKSIFLNDMPEKSGISVTEEFKDKWNLIYELRDEAKKALEIKRNEKIIGKSLEADVEIYADGDLFDKINAVASLLPEIFIVSRVEVLKGEGEFKGDMDGVSLSVRKASGEKCERCWIYSDDIGHDHDHPTLCARCASVVK